MSKFKNWPLKKKIVYIFDFPFLCIRKLVIPPCEVEEYDNWLVIVWPYLGILTAEMVVKKAWPTSAGFFYYLPCALLWSFLFWKFHKGGRREITKEHLLVSVIGMIFGYLWTYYVSGLLIDILTMMGIITKLSATYLALTIIAVGNALPDALLTIELAKKEKALLGITGSYAGQLFGLLVGFGVSMFKKSLSEGKPIPFDLFVEWNENIEMIIIIAVMLITLIFTMVYEITHELKFNRTVAIVLGVLYFGFILSVTIIEVIRDYF